MAVVSIVNNLDCFAEEFKGITLHDSKIEKAEFESCPFISCDFSETFFFSCRFVECRFENCNLIMQSVLRFNQLVYIRGGVLLGNALVLVAVMEVEKVVRQKSFT
ncbi:pentapeptide repeat-containing protein [Candidatus Sulfurimonas marisnigri]|uniref:pentapeptide repeat-containing protein n=1 Tax=Candidatus Sulfurimonas marisnigri TaxID=2740405 RepID=UPI001E619673|nr:pentapeptide repeat-containing protein [Candidatus Sulfurimonas marisnigri]